MKTPPIDLFPRIFPGEARVLKVACEAGVLPRRGPFLRPHTNIFMVFSRFFMGHYDYLFLRGAGYLLRSSSFLLSLRGHNLLPRLLM